MKALEDLGHEENEMKQEKIDGTVTNCGKLETTKNQS